MPDSSRAFGNTTQPPLISCGGCGSQPANTSPAAFRWVHSRKRVPRQNLIRSKNSAICTCTTANSLNSGHLYFVAHVAQISRGNAQANPVNSTDLAWSRLVRDQEDGGSNPLAPTNSIGTSNLHGKKKTKTAWIPTRNSKNPSASSGVA